MKSDVITEWLKSKFDIQLGCSFGVNQFDLKESNSKILYNKKIRDLLGKDPIQGVYIWSEPSTKEILYVGMSGKLIRDDKSSFKMKGNSYSLQKRLVSSRGKFKIDNDVSKKELTTYMYLKHIIFKQLNIESLNFHIFKIDIKTYSPTYIESCILHKIFKKDGVIPVINKSF